MRRHLQDYSFKSILRRHEAHPPGARSGAVTTAHLTNLRSSADAAPVVSARGFQQDTAQKVPPLQLSDFSRAKPGSQSARLPETARGSGAQQPTNSTAAATARGGTGIRDRLSHFNQITRLSTEASHSDRLSGSLHDKFVSTKLPRPRLPLLNSRRANGNAQGRRPLWSMAPSIPKLFASLVATRSETGLAAIDERLKECNSDDAMHSSIGVEAGAGASGRIALEHWMEFCRETDAFSKLHVAPSDCIFAFRRGVEAAGSNDSALARKAGLVMNLEAFCGCIVVLAELAGALPNDVLRAPHDLASHHAVHSVWDCDPEISKSCSLMLLKLLTAAPGMTTPKHFSLNSVAFREAAAATSSDRFPPPPAASHPKSLPVPNSHTPRSHATLLPPMSFSPQTSRDSAPRSSSPVKFNVKPSGPLAAAPRAPPLRKSSFSFMTDVDSSEVSSPTKSKSTSFKSCALTASPPAYANPRRPQLRARREERVQSNCAPVSTHHTVDVATGSEFLQWFQDKLTQVGSDGLAYPVRIVAVQVN